MQITYIASPESQQIYAWKMNEEGKMKLLQIVEVAGKVQPIALSPTHPFLYAGVRPNFRVIAYYISKDGTLNETGYISLPGSPTHISTDHQGNFLFCTSYNSACVSISPIGADGVPLPLIQVVQGLDGCHSANISNDNRILFVPALKQDRIYLFNVNFSGKLTLYTQPQVTTIDGAGPRHMAFHPKLKYAYCVNELNSTVDVWNLRDTKGQVKCVQSLNIRPDDFKGIHWAADIHLTPDGQYLYTCDRSSSIITIFSVNKEDALLKIAGYQPTEAQPRGFNIDNSGCFLVSAGQKSNHIEVYRIDKENGLLAPLARYAVGYGPISVVIYSK